MGSNFDLTAELSFHNSTKELTVIACNTNSNCNKSAACTCDEATTRHRLGCVHCFSSDYILKRVLHILCSPSPYGMSSNYIHNCSLVLSGLKLNVEKHFLVGIVEHF